MMMMMNRIKKKIDQHQMVVDRVVQNQQPAKPLLANQPQVIRQVRRVEEEERLAEVLEQQQQQRHQQRHHLVLRLEVVRYASKFGLK